MNQAPLRLALSCALLSACAASNPRPSAPRPITAAPATPAIYPARAAEWRSPLLREHPLVGRIWSVSSSSFVEPAALETDLAHAKYVLLGEKHDNADHHALQAMLLAALVRAGRRPVVAFEMIDTSRQPALDAYVAAHPHDPSGLGPALGWEEAGWPPWALYRPIADVALAAGLHLVGANLPRDTTRALARGGASSLEPALAKRLGLDMPGDADPSMVDELKADHCGTLPDRALAPMARVQRAWDAALRAGLVDADGGDGGVLIAGAGHVRTDRGAAGWGAALPVARSLAFVEVVRNKTDPNAYVEGFFVPKLPFDYVWFTPRASDDDPCASFAKRGPGG